MNRIPASPFDDYANENCKNNAPWLRPVMLILRVVCGLTLVLGFLSAIAILAIRLLRAANWVQSDLLKYELKSAVPLILIGVSLATLQFSLRRTFAERMQSLLVSIAFISWGAEQFLSNRALVTLIDDIVVFLFVLDLSIVIGGHLKQPE